VLQLQGSAGDPWLAGCAALFGAKIEPLPEGWMAQPRGQVMIERDDTVRKAVVLQAGGAAGLQLQRWEEQWFAPLLHDLRAQRIDAFTLRLGRRAWRVHRRLWSAPWRRRASWWQAVGT
jgi:hypothetical protein